LENGVRVVKVEAKKYEFVPKQIVVRLGEQVRLEVTSTDVTHGLAIPEYKIDRKLEPGKAEMITFTADKAGSFAFDCSVFCGLGHGEMEGRLEVLPAK
jgi:heme/copper-type cytochrome/quinol oxidase subunit 2